MVERRRRTGRDRALRLGALAILTGCLALPVRAELLTEPPAELAAPEMTLPRLDGGNFDLGARAGQVTVVNFWALWCAPCKLEMAELAALQRRLAGAGVAVVAVNLGDDPAEVRRYVEENELGDLTVVLEDGTGVAEAWLVGGLPVTYVVDPAGRIAYAAVGTRPWAAEAIATLLEALSTRQ
jgi:thiol-disulfide isomerase/thioredoxin